MKCMTFFTWNVAFSNANCLLKIQSFYISMDVFCNKRLNTSAEHRRKKTLDSLCTFLLSPGVFWCISISQVLVFYRNGQYYLTNPNSFKLICKNENFVLLSLLVSLRVVEAYLLNPLLSDGLVSLWVPCHATYLGLGRVQLILQKNHLGICCLQLVFIFCHVIPKTLHLLHLIRWKCKMYCK